MIYKNSEGHVRWNNSDSIDAKIMKEPIIVRCLGTGLKTAERFGFGMPVAGWVGLGLDRKWRVYLSWVQYTVLCLNCEVYNAVICW